MRKQTTDDIQTQNRRLLVTLIVVDKQSVSIADMSYAPTNSSNFLILAHGFNK